ncbi:MAG: hypothetical protein SVV80_08060 [Planctomycetota bacterium]|nr:hypothetical protein [Planctomycetota bacterium]
MEPLHAHSRAEARMYLMVTPCPNCSDGPWEITAEQANVETGQPNRMLLARCVHCRAEKKFLFDWSQSDQAEERSDEPPISSLELINSSPDTSRIIDVGQWLSLFYMLVEKASVAKDVDTRRVGFHAAQCLDEALKFYTEDDELPPKSAFFVASSRQAFAEHPEKFARQRLRDMRSKLPNLQVMVRRIMLDETKGPKKKWWQFWKR